MKKNIICLLGLALLVTGCAKKSKPVSNSASITPTSDSVVAPTSNESSAPVATSSSQSASISTSVAPSKTYTVVSEGTYEEADGVITLKTAEQKYSFKIF